MEQLTNESKEVLTLPEPGESSTDPDENNEIEDNNEITASIKEAGQKLGGEANVAFESEEDTPDTAIQNNLVIKTEPPETCTSPQTEPAHVLPALFFVHGVGGSANIWSSQLSYFAALGHEVIAPDLLGKNQDYTTCYSTIQAKC